MRGWVKRVRGAVLMGLTWALAWAPIGVMIGMLVDPHGAMDEPWIMVGALPGFIGGLVFATVLVIAGRRRRFEELSLGRFAAWGAAAGMLVGALPFLIGDAATGRPQWMLGGIVIGSTTLMSAASATGSLALARVAERREALGAGARMPGVASAGSAAPAASRAGRQQESLGRTR